MFGSSFKAAKCKTLLRLAEARIKLLRNKRENGLRSMRREMAGLLTSGHDASARIRVEHIMREQNILAAYDVLELFCELVVVRLPIVESQKECPADLREAISSIIFAAPRCADLPELLQAKQLFQAKYGKEFIAAAEELRPGCGVNRIIIEKLSVRAPSGEAKLTLLKEIALESGINWDPSSSEEQLLHKPHDDLLDAAPLRYEEPMPVPMPNGRDGADGPRGPGPLVMEPLYAPVATAPPISRKWVDPEAMDDRFAGPKLSPAVPPPSTHVGYPGASYSQGWGSPSIPPPSSGREEHEQDDGMTKIQMRQQDEDRERKMASIRDAADRARAAAQRAADAALSAAGLAASDGKDYSGEAATSGADHEDLTPVKPSKSASSPDDAYGPPPSKESTGSKGGGFFGSSRGGGGGGNQAQFMAVGRYGMVGGNNQDAPSAATGFATGSTFDDYVDKADEGVNRSREDDGDVDLPNPPGYGGRDSGTPEAPRTDLGSQGSLGLPAIDDLAARFDRLRERSGQMGGY